MLALRKGIGPLSAGTAVEVDSMDGDKIVGVRAHSGIVVDATLDDLVERRERSGLRGPNRKQRRAVDPIVKAKREEYEKSRRNAS